MKVDRFLQTVFLPLSAMKEKYSILNKLPILLPVMWLARCLEILFRDRAGIKRYFDNVKHIDTTKIEANRRALNAVGLDFNNDEQVV